MIIKRIEQLAKHKHALLLGMASLALCTSFNGFFLASGHAASKPVQAAQHADLRTTLDNHPFTSMQFSNLLIHNFHIHSDSDIAHGKSAINMNNYNTIANKHNTFRFHNSVLQVKVRGCHPFGLTFVHSYYSDVSDSSDDSSVKNPPLITYQTTSHHLYLQELFMNDGQSKNTLRTVSYKLDKIHDTNYGKELVLLPVSYTLKHKHFTKIPQKVQKQYPLKLAMINKHKIVNRSPFPSK